MRTLIPVPEWHEQGLCRQVDPELFYPEKGAANNALRQARRICTRCEVRAECRQDAIDRAEPYGVWGGTTGDERRRIRRTQREASC